LPGHKQPKKTRFELLRFYALETAQLVAKSNIRAFRILTNAESSNESLLTYFSNDSYG